LSKKEEQVMKSEKQKIRKVYMLYHRDKKNDDKLIGFFSTKEKALEIVDKWKEMKGFRDFPEGFKIRTMIIGKDYCTKGFKSKSLK